MLVQLITYTKMENKIIIAGVNEYSKVVCDAIVSQGKYTVVGFLDDTLQVGTPVMSGYKVLGSFESTQNSRYGADSFVVAIENNNERKRIFETLKQNLAPATVVHASAIVGSTVTLGEGSVVLANAVVNSSIGMDTIVKPGVVVDHECVIGNHVHLGTGTFVRSPFGTMGKSQIVIGDRYSTVGHTLQMLMPSAPSGKSIGIFMSIFTVVAIVLLVFMILQLF